jgi:hypothetical protein
VSTFAAARVETKIVLQGEGNAAKAVADVRRELDAVGSAAGKAGKAAAATTSGLEAAAKTATGTVQRSGAAFAGLAAVLGGSVVPEVAKIGQSFTAAGSAANLLPGPIGLAATGVAALALGAFELAKHFAESAAKVKELGNAGTEALADRLKLSVDQAVKLQQSFEDLPSALQPTDGLLEAVRARAESIGKDGGDAVQKFVDALGKGPAAVQDFEREFGRLAATSAKLPDVAQRLGLSTAALGVATGLATEADRAKVAAEQAVNLDRQRQGLLSAAAALEAQIGSASLARTLQLEKQADSLRRQAGVFDSLVQRATDEANALQLVVDRQREATEAAAQRGRVADLVSAEIAVQEAQAAAQLDKQRGLQFAMNAAQLRGAEIDRRKAELQAQFSRGLLTEIDYRKELAGLEVQGFQLAAVQLAVGRQAKADLDARRQKARQAADAELSSLTRLARAEADRIEASAYAPGQVAARLKQLALEELAEIGKARRDINTAKGREAAVAAIRQEFAAKRQALDKAVADNELKLAEENRAVIEAGNQRAAEAAIKLAEVVAGNQRAQSGRLAQALRDRGKDDAADLTEKRQAHADYVQTIEQLDADLAGAQARTAAGSEERFTAERINLVRSEQAWRDYNDRVGAIDAAAAARFRESIAAAADAIKVPAAMLAGSGGAGAKIGKALQATAEGVASVSRGWKGMRQSAPDAISAVGGVVAAFVDGEKTKAGILAVTEAAAAVASYPNVPAMVAHGAAAVLYGSVAAGVVGGGGGAPSIPSAADLGAASGGGTAGGAGAGAGGGQVVNVYFGRGFVVGTPQQVGSAVQGAVSSLKGSGLKVSGGV